MLAVAGGLPSADGGWAYEFKWDGVRALTRWDGEAATLYSRTGREITASYPEAASFPESLKGRSAFFDGEIVALDEAGRPSFQLLQGRMNRERRRGGVAPAVVLCYFVFDCCFLDGELLLARPYEERRERLSGLGLDGGAVTVPPVPGAAGPDTLHLAEELGLEGVVAKRRDSPYRPGKRSGEWVKVKLHRTQEVVVGGFTRGAGRRQGSLGALVVGIPEGGKLRYVGRVGTGFTDEMLEELARRLGPAATIDSPFGGPVERPAEVTYVAPSLVGEVEFVAFTDAGRLRAPSWRGLRPDKSPDEVVVEGDGEGR